MAELTLAQAINLALREEMARDERIVLLGEDVGRLGGVFRVTEGLQAEFGEHRVIDTPLNEIGIVGAAIGMAMTGLRPCVEIQFADFIYPAFDQIVNELAKVRFRSGGQFNAPVVIRTPFGAGVKGGLYHSQSPEAYFVHTAGLQVVVPSGPALARGLLKSALRGEDPVLILEPKRIYRAPEARQALPDGEGLVPIGTARIDRPGANASLFTYGAMLYPCREAARTLASEGIDVEIVDLATLWPLDIETVLQSVQRTGRAVIVHEAPRTCGYGAEIAALIAERALDYLQAPIVRVTGADTPVPFALEPSYLPTGERIAAGIRTVTSY